VGWFYTRNNVNKADIGQRAEGLAEGLAVIS